MVKEGESSSDEGVASIIRVTSSHQEDPLWGLPCHVACPVSTQSVGHLPDSIECEAVPLTLTPATGSVSALGVTLSSWRGEAGQTTAPAISEDDLGCVLTITLVTPSSSH